MLGPDHHQVQRIALLAALGIGGAAGELLQGGAQRSQVDPDPALRLIKPLGIDGLVVEAAARQFPGEVEAQHMPGPQQLDVDQLDAPRDIGVDETADRLAGRNMHLDLARGQLAFDLRRRCAARARVEKIGGLARGVEVAIHEHRHEPVGKRAAVLDPDPDGLHAMLGQGQSEAGCAFLVAQRRDADGDLAACHRLAIRAIQVASFRLGRIHGRGSLGVFRGGGRTGAGGQQGQGERAEQGTRRGGRTVHPSGIKGAGLVHGPPSHR